MTSRSSSPPRARRAARPSWPVAQLLRYQVRRAAREGDLAKEIALAEGAIEQDHEQPAWFYANLAEALFQQGDTPGALDALEEARRRDSWPLGLDLRFLGEFQRQGLDRERRAVVRRLSALRPDHPSVNEQMARAYLDLGLFEEASREMNAGLAVAPQSPRLSALRVRQLRREKAWAELVRVSEPLHESYPANRLFRAALIDALVGTGEIDKALEARDAIMATSPPDPDGMAAVSRALVRGGRPTEAPEIVERALETAPKRAGLHVLRSNCLRALGREEEAAAARRRSQEVAGDGGRAVR